MKEDGISKKPCDSQTTHCLHCWDNHDPRNPGAACISLGRQSEYRRIPLLIASGALLGVDVITALYANGRKPTIGLDSIEDPKGLQLWPSKAASLAGGVIIIFVVALMVAGQFDRVVSTGNLIFLLLVAILVPACPNFQSATRNIGILAR